MMGLEQRLQTSLCDIDFTSTIRYWALRLDGGHDVPCATFGRVWRSHKLELLFFHLGGGAADGSLTTERSSRLEKTNLASTVRNEIHLYRFRGEGVRHGAICLIKTSERSSVSLHALDQGRKATQTDAAFIRRKASRLRRPNDPTP